MKRSKSYRQADEHIDHERLYSPAEAVDLAKSGKVTKFDPTVEVALRLGVDPRKQDQMVRGTVNLPNGTGKTARVLVFANGDRAEAARAARSTASAGLYIPNPTLIRERLEWVKDEIILAPGRFHLAWMRDKDYLTGGTYIVGCVAGWLDYLENGEDHFNPTRSNLQIRLTAANMIGSEDIYPTLFNHELNTGAVYGTVEYAEFGCRMIDEYLKGIGTSTRKIVEDEKGLAHVYG